MTELEAARQIRDGLLPSPWKLGEMALWAMRLTGTGLSYRSGHDEYVWRSPDIYLTEEFRQRCNGLPIIWDHPKDAPALNSKEFRKRVIGTVMLPYLKEDSVWGICRVYDEEANRLMTEGQLSTSPAVVFSPGDGNEKLELNGETFLIEGTPSLLDHCAVVAQGVWDKGGPADGVLNDVLHGNDSMSETETEKKEREEREDKGRKDAAEKMDRLDALLSKMDARLDAMEADKARKDAAEKERDDKARHDAARKDRFGHRKDGESYKDWKSRHDADEMGMCDALEKGGCEKDKARKDAASCRADAEEEERKDGGESFEKWAKEESEEPEHKEDRSRKDNEADMKREEQDKARHDAQTREIAELKELLAKQGAVLKSLTTEIPASERDALAMAQSRADSVSAMYGERAPAPMSGETALDYRKRLLSKFAKSNPRFKDSRFDGMDAATLEPIETIVYADSIEAARSPGDGADHVGVLIPHVTREGGRDVTRYTGDILAAFLPFMSGGTTGKFNRNPKAN